MRARTAAAIAAGIVGGVRRRSGFTAVYREGFETVLFYQALSLFADGPRPLGLARRGRRRRRARGGRATRSCASARSCRSSRCCSPARAILLLLSVAFAGNAVRSLQEADLLAVTPVHGGWARLPVFAAELTGIHPTVQGLVVQAVAAGDLRPRRGLGLRAPRRRCGAGARRRRSARHDRAPAGLRVGVDVGGTFTKAVAVERAPPSRCGPTPSSRRATTRPTASSRASRRRCASCSTSSASDRDAVELVAFSTTTAMNALLEGDVARVGVVGIGAPARPAAGAQAHARGRARRSRPGACCTPSTPSSTRPAASATTRSTPPSTACGARAARRSRPAAPTASTRPSTRTASSARARARGSPACAGHELTGAYGLEVRTVSAAVNASILADRRAHGRRRRARAARGRGRRAAARPARRRRRDGARRLPPGAVAEPRLGARGGRGRGAAGARR